MRSRFVLMFGLLAVVALVASAGCQSMQAKARKKKTITMDQVPLAAKTAIEKAAGDWKIDKVLLEHWHGNPVYVAEFESYGYKKKISVDQDGAVIKKPSHQPAVGRPELN